MRHLTPDQIVRWRSRTLTSDEVLTVSDHVEECESCRTALAADHPAQAVAAALSRQLAQADAPHATASELAAWVDGADGSVATGAISSHLAVCPLCRAEAEDLRGFVGTRGAPTAARRWWRALAAASISLVAATLLLLSLREGPRSAQGVADVAPPPGAPQTSGGHAELEAAESAAEPLLRDGELVIADSSPEALAEVPRRWRDRVAAVLADPDLAIPATALAMVRTPEVQRGEHSPQTSALALEQPLSAIVLDERPTFRWRGPADAEYELEVYDAHFAPVSSSGVVRGEAWRPEAPLPRERVLTWRLMVTRDGEQTMLPTPPSPPAVFRVASAGAAADVAAARASGSRLLTGLALWEAGMVREAAAELAALREQNPDSPLAAALAASSARGVAALEAAGRD